MGLIGAVVRWEVVILLVGIFGIVFWKMLTGQISLHGLLEADVHDPNSPDGSGLSSRASAGRVQALALTIFVALWYLFQVIHHPTEFPRLPDALVTALGGSQGIYLGGNAYGLLIPKLRNQFRTGD